MTILCTYFTLLIIVENSRKDAAAIGAIAFASFNVAITGMHLRNAY